MAEHEERKRAGVEREYRNDGIVVYWAPQLCIHTGNCLRARPPEVFDTGRRPWMDASAATADDIAEAVMTCPTGALTFERLDGGEQEVPESGVTVQTRTNGPLFVRGDVTITDAQGEVVRTSPRMALCRCGGSANKPFCDNTHRSIGFRG
jgi:uncharacterized Fe-S cluster protein YjdI